MNWRISHSDAVVEDTDEWSLVAVVYGANGDPSIDDVTKSRAAIIAAAPELLEACKSAHRAIILGNGRTIDWDAIADQLYAAIAKAEGAK